jgi:hypothetical protein
MGRGVSKDEGSRGKEGSRDGESRGKEGSRDEESRAKEGSKGQEGSRDGESKEEEREEELLKVQVSRVAVSKEEEEREILKGDARTRNDREGRGSVSKGEVLSGGAPMEQGWIDGLTEELLKH